ncbi:flavin-containing monooxygenase [Xylariomycetidae sp. FL0641]|nr:flavin-containing monooxygenase [Xylariomycetidae sp. FL0641]
MTVEAEKKRVLIVGAGVSGLVSLKECLAGGLEADVFEARDEIGGQWAYQPIGGDAKTEEVRSAVYEGVVLNSCRDTSSFSDFPFDPARYGDYFGHRRMLEYLREYADRFQLRKHIHLRTQVLGCRPLDDDDDDGGRWSVQLQREDRPVEEATYDVVFAATGSNAGPLVPGFAGREAFRGEFLHSQCYRTPGPYEGKRVALIGFGSAAVDLACELAPGCREVHLVARRGGWVLPRYVLGKPTEAWDNRATQVWLPSSLAQSMQSLLLNVVQGQHPDEIKPAHKVLEQNPTVRTEFLERLRTGTVQAHRTEVESFTGTGLRLANGTALEVDVVIACTGYQRSLPYLPADVLRSPTTPPESVDLWKLMVPLRYENLFLIGYAEVAGPAPPTFEAQARLAVATLTGRAKLPGVQQREKEVKAWQAWHAKHFVRSERHAITETYVPYIDSLLAPLGANPTMGKMLSHVVASGHPWRALKTLNAVYFGLTSSAQWRLFGHGKNARLAEATVLRTAAGKGKLSDQEVKLM